ncbi:ornithine decarboxylase SPE1 [Sugiyamaella lignohabitans]|uniref:ornithine decarboxylase n=1 Tax=Sugiyamaella lignohabitans TaxID=796027 RepID=A0A161HJW3_9ASCO|nr:ornithine decarboxylase SPE1 [Sugiyamaella lignohabitans]ANB13107.1 ornithine decarboxylase SPE1 [Sugiyamaella lignohabitans]
MPAISLSNNKHGPDRGTSIHDKSIYNSKGHINGSLYHEHESQSTNLIGNVLREKIQSIDLDTCLSGGEDSFFVADLGVVYRQHVRWIKNLPRIEPFYAVKCNGDPQVLNLLVKLGLSFDCASKNEISSILDLGVDPSRIIYANPVKTPSYLGYARQQGVGMMTFDNSDELLKCKKFYPDAQLLLRIMTDDSTATCQLSVKFGAPMSDTKKLLALAKELNLNVVGVAFHVGSGASDPTVYAEAVENSRQVFDEALELGFPPLSILDVGGGFEDDCFEIAAEVLNNSLAEHFPDDSVRVIAEPGRYYVATAFTLATSVIGRRWVDEQKGKAMIYVNDGVYGNLNSILFDHQNPVPRPLTSGESFLYNGKDEIPFHHRDHHSSNYEFSVWGPTCDGLDCISKSVLFPVSIDVGDWLYFNDVGAYTLAASTTFNGFNLDCKVHYVCSSPEVDL